MSDGSKFTAVAQAVNEAKWLVDYHLENKLNSELFEVGFLPEELFKFNKFKIVERLVMKKALLFDKELVEVKKLEKKERENLKFVETFNNVFIPIIEKKIRSCGAIG